MTVHFHNSLDPRKTNRQWFLCNVSVYLHSELSFRMAISYSLHIILKMCANKTISWPFSSARSLCHGYMPSFPPPPKKWLGWLWTSGGCSIGAGAWGRSGGVGTGTGPGGAGTWGSSGGASTGTGPGGVGTGTGPGGAGTWGSSGGASTGTGPGGVGTGTGPGGAGTWGHSGGAGTGTGPGGVGTGTGPGGAGTGTGSGGVGTGMVPGGVGTGGTDTWGHLWGAGTGGHPLQHIPSYATNNPRGTWAAAGGLDYRWVSRGHRRLMSEPGTAACMSEPRTAKCLQWQRTAAGMSGRQWRRAALAVNAAGLTAGLPSDFRRLAGSRSGPWTLSRHRE